MNLTFDHETHIYRVDGAVVPSVTQILKPLSDFSGIPPQVLEAKRDLGTRVHEACHYFDEDDLDEDTIDADVEPYLDAWIKFKKQSGARVLMCETRLFEPVLRFAGTMDRVLLLNGEHWLVDLKTSFSLPHAVGPQTAGYLRALMDPTVTRRGALRLRNDGSYRLDALTEPNDWAVFMACLTLHRFITRCTSCLSSISFNTLCKKKICYFRCLFS